MTAEQRTPREAVEAYVRALESGHSDRIAELFAEKVDWCVPGAEEVPWLGTRSTREDVADFFTVLYHHVAKEEFAIEQVLADDQHAVALGHLRSRVRANNALMESWFAIHMTVTDGQITRYRFYEDSLAIMRAWQAPGRPQPA